MNQSTKPLVYVIEDDQDVADLICSSLGDFRFEVNYWPTGKQALSALEKKRPDICIVDLNLPDMDGLELIKQLESYSVGLIIVSGRGALPDRILGLEFGADDYITKPFEPRELVARVQSLTRRLSKKKQSVKPLNRRAHFASWVFKPDSLSLEHQDKGEETLSRAEGDMLLALINHPFQILSRDRLLGENCIPYDRSIDVRVSRLRKKLEIDSQHPELIKTVYGAGYMFIAEVNWE